METVFDKPLDKEVASLNDHISTIITPVQLWANMSGAASGEIEMSESVDNYEYLLIRYRTNTERCYKFVKSDERDAIFLSISAFNATGLVSDFSYKSTATIKFTTSTKATVSVSYNNANWIVKPMQIFGVGKKFS